MFWTFKANKGDLVAGESCGNAFDNFGLVFNTIIPTSHQDTDSFLSDGGAPHVFYLGTPLLSLFLLTLCKYK